MDGSVSPDLAASASDFWRDWLAGLAIGNLPERFPLRHWNEVNGRASRQWNLESRQVEGASQPGWFYSSLSHGEDYVGGWETGVWDIAEAKGELAFDLVGHKRLPGQPTIARNESN